MSNGARWHADQCLGSEGLRAIPRDGQGRAKPRSRPGVGAECAAKPGCGRAGDPGDRLSLSLRLEPGLVEPVDVVDNADGTQTVNYVPSREGPYSISVMYGEEEVPRR